MFLPERGGRKNRLAGLFSWNDGCVFGAFYSLLEWIERDGSGNTEASIGKIDERRLVTIDSLVVLQGFPGSVRSNDCPGVDGWCRQKKNMEVSLGINAACRVEEAQPFPESRGIDGSTHLPVLDLNVQVGFLVIFHAADDVLASAASRRSCDLGPDGHAGHDGEHFFARGKHGAHVRAADKGCRLVVAVTGKVVEVAQVDSAGNAFTGGDGEWRKVGEARLGQGHAAVVAFDVDVEPGDLVAAAQMDGSSGVVADG